MKMFALSLALLTGCWFGLAASYEPDPYVWCLDRYYPDARCESGGFFWVNEGYSYRGRWHGGHYVRRPRIRDHR